jgi:ketosteroid isomerase-like protein
MTHSMVCRVLVFGAALAYVGCWSPAARASDTARDEALLRQYIVESGDAFNRRDLKAMLARVSPDLVLTYPGVPDMGYDDLAKSYAEMIAQPPGIKLTTVPSVEEVIVSGELAVVRITWTTTTASASQSKVRRMRDLQVWRRSGQGEWRFIRGIHFREPAVGG